MLVSLTLRDFAVVSEAEVRFTAGFGVVSGETGAGKSLLVDALNLLAGARADSGMVRHSAARAEVEGEFSLDASAAALSWLRGEELDDGTRCHLRRVLRADGGSRAWINGRSVSLAQLQQLSTHLLEIHGQHEAQALLERSHQLRLLDAYAGHGALVDTLAKLAEEWRAGERERAHLMAQGDVSEHLHRLRHEFDELECENLDPAFVESLDRDQRRLRYAVDLASSCSHVASILAGDEGLAPQELLAQLASNLRRAAEWEPALQEIAGMLESASIQVDEAQRSLNRVRDGLDLDPEHLERIEQTLGRLYDLGRKHRVSIAALAGVRERIRDEIEVLADRDARLARIDQEQRQRHAAWLQQARMLREQRQSAAARLCKAVDQVLHELGMPGARFSVEFESVADDTPSAVGLERCEFMITTNPGQPPRPLRKVASGGELSRISLAIEVSTLDIDAVPTMVFDEVDAGIGGAVAEVVGRKLRALGVQRQVLCVTHLAQVAAQAHHHIRVRKDSRRGVTRSEVMVLDESGRIEELARMLGGIQITDATRAHAAQMLRAAQST